MRARLIASAVAYAIVVVGIVFTTSMVQRVCLTGVLVCSTFNWLRWYRS